MIDWRISFLVGWSKNERATTSYLTSAIPDRRPIWQKNFCCSNITREIYSSICYILADNRIHMDSGRFLGSRFLPLALYSEFSDLAQRSTKTCPFHIKNGPVLTKSNYNCSGNERTNPCSNIGPTSHGKILVPRKKSVISPTKLHINPK